MSSASKKPTQIKPWPELVGLSPLLGSAYISRKAIERIHLDLSHIHKLDVIGLSIFLAILAQKNVSSDIEYDLSLPHSALIRKKLEELEFFKNLNLLGYIPNRQQSLFDNNSSTLPIAQRRIEIEKINVPDIYIEKVIAIIPKKNLDREKLLTEAKRKIKDFLLMDSKRHFNHEQILIILTEMIKNSIDHSGKTAILGLQFYKQQDGKGKFSFVFCDTGDGICKTVRKHFKQALEQLTNKTDLKLVYGFDMAELTRLSEKGGFSDILHWAFQPGNSTKRESGVNLGIGLRWIIEGSKMCNIQLYLKDADSILTLSKLASAYTHSEIRELAITTCAPPLFLFHGELEC